MKGWNMEEVKLLLREVLPKLHIRPWRRHSLVLMVAGLVFIGVGIQYILVDLTPERARALAVSLRFFPVEFWGVVWIICGVMVVISARWPAFSDTWGYAVLTGMSAGWAATYVMGMIFMNSPLSNINGATVWGLIAFLWWAISGLLNPDRVVLVVVEDGRR